MLQQRLAGSQAEGWKHGSLKACSSYRRRADLHGNAVALLQHCFGALSKRAPGLHIDPAGGITESGVATCDQSMSVRTSQLCTDEGQPWQQ